jgi:hypothetical protein
VAILIGAALVFLMFPRRDRERELLASYHEEDTRKAATPAGTPG